MKILILIILFQCCYERYRVRSYRILNNQNHPINASYFLPFDKGFVGRTDDAANFIRERVNEGALRTADQEIIYEGVFPRQSCPQMVGPFSDGNFYCTARDYGYCDRRSGTCFCNVGYDGIDCSQCTSTHYRVGNLCYPKQLCPNDCNSAGVCNFNNGTCSCFPHRTGSSCESLVCKVLDERCESCTVSECLRCEAGYYLTGNSISSNISSICSSCYDFDPRCGGCTREDGCTICADPLLTSVRRSGYRSFDPKLPIEEETRELSIALPFGTKSMESFAEAENFNVVGRKDSMPLNANTKNCTQGENLTDSWRCEPYPASHVVCGHYGVFRLKYPNYRVPESYGYLPLTVMRSGGGYGEVKIAYHIQHISTNYSDVTATAQYTTSQVLIFESGIVEMTFLVNILQDNIVEEDEVFQVVLEYPIGGGSLGSQYRASVTIVDDDLFALSSKYSTLAQNITYARANEVFTITINAAVAYQQQRMLIGGESFYAVVENDADMQMNRKQRNSPRTPCDIIDQQDGTYTVKCAGLHEQGSYQLRVWHVSAGGLRGQYYSDAFFQHLVLERIDRGVDFSWGYGRLSTTGSDYVSIRWTGVLQPSISQDYYFQLYADDRARLWIDGEIIIDHWQERGTYLDFPRQLYLAGNRYHEVIIEYLEVDREAYCHLLWGDSPSNLTVITSDYLSALNDINRSPATVVIASSYTSPNHTECYGSGLFEGDVLQTSSFSICPRDEFGNLRNDDDRFFLMDQDFKASLRFIDEDPLSQLYDGLGSEYIEPQLVYNIDTSCFDAFYVPQRAGAYILSIVFGERRFNESIHVLGSPFSVIVTSGEAFGPYSDIIL